MKKLSTLLILLLCSIATGYCQTNSRMGNKIIDNELYAPTKSKVAEDYYNRAHADMEQRNFQRAIENLERAIAADSNYIDAYDNLGIAFRQLGKLDSAEHYYLISRSKYPAGTVALRNLAVVEEMRKNNEKAIAYYKQALAIEPKDAESYYGLTRQYMQMERYADAIANAKIVEQYYKESNSPYIGDCYLTQCVIYIMMNKANDARKYMRLAMETGMTIDPQIAAALK